MVSTTIKYCALFFCIFYVYVKSQKSNIDKTRLFIGFIIAIALGIITSLIRIMVDPMYSMLVYIVFALSYSLFFNIKIRYSIITSILSIGFAYASFSFACIPIAFLFNTLHIDAKGKWDEIWIFSSIAIVQIILTVFSMKSKRIKSGLSYLINGGASDVGIYISTLLVFIVVLMGNSKSAHYVYFIPIVLTVICSLTLFFWRKNQITQLYIDRTKEQEIALLEQSLEEKDKLIESLRTDNENLSQIIHKDNKLIPAMILAVKKYISEVEDTQCNKDSIAEAADILMQLESIYAGRMQAVKNYELTQKKLPSVGLASTDAVIFYLHQKAIECGVTFDLCVSADVKHMTEIAVDKDDLNTLLADLIENAIISAKGSTNKCVMVSVSVKDSIYSVAVYDSGERFDINVLKNIGQKRITTHLNDGGSGIGMMTTFAMLQKYSAEFLIEEYSNNTNFSKKVEILFNGTNARKIITPRYQELINELKHTNFAISDKA